MDELDKSTKSCAIKVYLSNLVKRKSHVTLVVPEILTGFQIKKLAIRKIGMNEQQLMSTELLLSTKETNPRSNISNNYEDSNNESVTRMYHVLDTDCPSHFISLKSCEFHIYWKESILKNLKLIPHVSQVNSRAKVKDRLSSVLNTELRLEELPGYRGTNRNFNATSNTHADNINNNNITADKHFTGNNMNKNITNNNTNLYNKNKPTNDQSKNTTSDLSYTTFNVDGKTNSMLKNHNVFQSNKSAKIDNRYFVEYDPNDRLSQNNVIEKVKLRERPTKLSDEVTCRPPLSSVRNSLLITKNEFTKLESEVISSNNKLSNHESSMNNKLSNHESSTNNKLSNHESSTNNGLVPVNKNIKTTNNPKLTQDNTSDTNVQSPSSSYSSSSLECKMPLNSSMPSLVKHKPTRNTRLSTKRFGQMMMDDDVLAINHNINNNNNNKTHVNKLDTNDRTNGKKTNSTSSNNSTMSSNDLSIERQSSLNENYVQRHKNTSNTNNNHAGDKLTTSRRLLPQVTYPEEMVEEKRYLLSKKLEQRIIRRVSNRDVDTSRQKREAKNMARAVVQEQPLRIEESDFDCKSMTSLEVANIMADAGPMGVVESDYEEPKTSDVCEDDEGVNDDTAADDEEDLFASKKNRFPSLFDSMKSHIIDESDFEDLNEDNKSNSKSFKTSTTTTNTTNVKGFNGSFVQTVGFVPYSKTPSSQPNLTTMSTATTTSVVATTTTSSTETSTVPSSSSMSAISITSSTTSKQFLTVYDILDSNLFQLLTICQHVDKKTATKNQQSFFPFEILNSTVVISSKSFKNSNINESITFSIIKIGKNLEDVSKNIENDGQNVNKPTSKTRCKNKPNSCKSNTSATSLINVTGDDNFSLKENDIIVELNGKNALIMNVQQLSEELSSPSFNSINDNNLLKLVVARRLND